MNTRKIWRNETDWYSAESREEAMRMMVETYGYSQDDIAGLSGCALEFEPMPDDATLRVTLQDGFEGGLTHPNWADEEPEATVEWVNTGRHPIARVTAPARIWAKHETGMVCSTEY